jgi:hypothetical protein
MERALVSKVQENRARGERYKKQGGKVQKGRAKEEI